MPRRARIVPGELVYHTLNRANGRNELFSKPEDYVAFERIMVAAIPRFPIRLLAYCLMPNHWHMVLWPKKGGELTAFLRWLTLTHSQRLHAHRHTTGYGHIYHGRFKVFRLNKISRYLTCFATWSATPCERIWLTGAGLALVQSMAKAQR